MFTQQQLDELHKNAPKTPSGNINASSISADDFLNQVKANRNPVNKSQTNFNLSNYNTIPGVPNFMTPGPGMVQAATDTTKNIAGDWMNRIHSLIDTGGDMLKGKAGIHDLAIQVPGEAAGGVLDVLGEGVKSVVKGISNSTPQFVKDSLKQGVTQVLQNPQVKQGISYLQNTPAGKIPAQYEQWKQQNPQDAKNLESLINMVTLAAGGLAEKAAEPILSEGAEAITNGVKPIGEMIAETPGKIKQGMLSKFIPKTSEELAKISESQVGKLGYREQAEWYRLQGQKALTEKGVQLGEIHQEAGQKIAYNQQQSEKMVSNLAQKSEQEVADLKVENEALDKKLSETAVKSTTDVRPEIKESFKKQSDTWKELRNQEIEPYKNVQLKNSDIISRIDEALPGEFDIGEKVAADRIKKSLKLKEEGTTSVGDLYGKIQAVKSDLSSAAKAGKRVYTQDEMYTEKVLGNMGQFLESQGLDLSASNKFWATWKDIQGEMVKKFNPFNTAETEGGAGMRLLTGIAKGELPEEKVFMGKVENLLGRKLTTKEEGIVSQIKSNESKITSSKEFKDLATQSSKSANDYAKELIKIDEDFRSGKISSAAKIKAQNLKAMKFNTYSQATIRKVLKIAIGYIGIKGVEKVFGFDVPYVPGI